MHTAVQYAKKQDCGASIPPLSSDLTVTGDVQFHQLHEVGNLRGKSLYFIVTQAQFAQVQKPKERLGQEENKTGSAAVLWKMCRLTSGQASILDPWRQKPSPLNLPPAEGPKVQSLHR